MADPFITPAGKIVIPGLGCACPLCAQPIPLVVVQKPAESKRKQRAYKLQAKLWRQAHGLDMPKGRSRKRRRWK